MKKDLILLHGALGAASGFDRLANFLSEDFTVHRPDFRGHGKNEQTGQLSIELLVDDLRDYLQVHKLNQASIFGYSMGGYVALSLALKEPDLVAEIMTLATKFDWNPEGAAKESKFLDADKLLEKVPNYALHLQKLHGQKWKQLLKNTAGMLLELGANPPLSATTLPLIKIPVYLNLGDSDKMVSAAESEWAVDLLPKSRLTIFEDTQHPWEQVNPLLVAIQIQHYF